MKLRRLKSFEDDFHDLPSEIKGKARAKLRLFVENPRHQSLKVKKMQGRSEIWEGHISAGYVFTFMWETEESGEQIAILRRIGKHDVYRKP